MQLSISDILGRIEQWLVWWSVVGKSGLAECKYFDSIALALLQLSLL